MRLSEEGSRWAPRALALLRIVAGAMFLTAGTVKLFDWPSTGYPGLPVPPGTEPWVAGVLELVLGPLIAVGLLTRPAAFLASGEMAVAYFQFYASKSPYPVVNGGLDPVLYCFLFFYLSFAGGGAWSVDGLLRRRRE